MALSRSASGPGGLSINTGAANAFGANNSQPPPAGGLFGSSTATSQAPAAAGAFGTATTQPAQSNIFGASATSQPTQTSGLFGASTATQPTQTGGGLFGSKPTIQTQQTGGLFGGAQTSTTQPTQTGGAFGTAPSMNQPQQTGGLFGQSTINQPQQTGLFGAQPQAQPQVQAQQTGGLFGQQQPTQTTTGGTGFFGQNQPATGLFSTSAAQNKTMGPGFGNSAQQTVPGARIDLQNIKGTTRFQDTHDDVQKEIAAIDKAIQQLMSFHDQIDNFMPEHQKDIESILYSVELMEQKYEAVKARLNDDIVAVKYLLDGLNSLVANAKVMFKAIDGLNLPSHYHTTNLWGQGSTPAAAQSTTVSDSDGQDILAFFNQQVVALTARHDFIQERLKEVQDHMPGVEGGVYERIHALQEGSSISEEPVRMVFQALTDLHVAINNQAEHVAETRQKVMNLQLNLADKMGGMRQ